MCCQSVARRTSENIFLLPVYCQNKNIKIFLSFVLPVYCQNKNMIYFYLFFVANILSEQKSEIISKCFITSVWPETKHKIIYKFILVVVIRLTKSLFFSCKCNVRCQFTRLPVCIQCVVRLLPEADNTLAILPVYCQK